MIESILPAWDTTILAPLSGQTLRFALSNIRSNIKLKDLGVVIHKVKSLRQNMRAAFERVALVSAGVGAWWQTVVARLGAGLG